MSDLGMEIPNWASHFGWLTSRDGKLNSRIILLKASGDKWEAEDGSLWEVESTEGYLVLRYVKPIPFLCRKIKRLFGPPCGNFNVLPRLKL